MKNQLKSNALWVTEGIVEKDAMKLSKYLITATVVAALSGLLFGFDTAVIAGTTYALRATFQLSPATLGNDRLYGTATLAAGSTITVGERRIEIDGVARWRCASAPMAAR
jgi:hypothetical protein